MHATLHGTRYISAILGKPDLVVKFLSEIMVWRGLSIIEISVNDELVACEIASKVGLGFDDGLHYYFARKKRIPIVSFDKDFDKTDIKRLEPHEILEDKEEKQ